MAKKIGIMGGTFDPIHLGHLIIAENAYETFNLDEVLFIPTGPGHHKEAVCDAKTRLQLTGISIEDNSHFALSTIEADNPEISYTADTISRIKELHPANEYYFIVGADAFVNMSSWKNPEQIFDNANILVAERLGTDCSLIDKKIEEYSRIYNATVFKLPITCVDISSSNIRERVKKNLSLRYMCHYKAIEFINKNGLYREDNE